MVPTAAVTGAGSGIGYETCRQLLVQGWRVFALDLSPAALASLMLPSENRARLVSIECDVRCEESVTRAFGEIAGAAPALDALICSAGVLRTASLLSMAPADFDQLFAVNTRAHGCARVPPTRC